MARTHKHRAQDKLAAPPADGARALAILIVLAAFLLSPFIATIGKPQNAATPQVAQVLSNPSTINKRCPKKTLPGQQNACASSSVPVAGFEGRSVALARVAQRSTITPLYDVGLTTQCCGAPPDRPPRFAA